MFVVTAFVAITLAGTSGDYPHWSFTICIISFGNPDIRLISRTFTQRVAGRGPPQLHSLTSNFTLTALEDWIESLILTLNS